MRADTAEHSASSDRPAKGDKTHILAYRIPIPHYAKPPLPLPPSPLPHLMLAGNSCVPCALLCLLKYCVYATHLRAWPEFSGRQHDSSNGSSNGSTNDSDNKTNDTGTPPPYQLCGISPKRGARGVREKGSAGKYHKQF